MYIHLFVRAATMKIIMGITSDMIMEVAVSFLSPADYPWWLADNSNPSELIESQF